MNEEPEWIEHDGSAVYEHREAPLMTRPTEPDPLSFWRGLVVGLCMAVCIWIMLLGGVFAAFAQPF